MIARIAAAAVSLVVGLGAAGCVSFYEVLVETPIQAKLDITPFRRVLVAGFVSGGTLSIDPNTETARLLRSQLRNRGELMVIDADVIELVDEVDRRRIDAGLPIPEAVEGQPRIVTEGDLAVYEEVFNDQEFWARVGEAYDMPLIVTGSVLFTEVSRSGLVSRPQQFINGSTGQTEYREVRQWTEQRGFVLTPTFIFIDGRTGEQLYSESFHEEALYPTSQNTPALSSYFELMDKLLPGFLNTLSTQKIRGSRILVK